jgi:aspartyl-tRNA(Asn)/glutamyl-tRNA(Gln) amidotransferase subunit A
LTPPECRRRWGRSVQGLSAPQDASPIDTLRKAGAIILGKATLSEYAAGDTYGSMFGITRNPYDLEPLMIGNQRLRAANLAS